MNCVTHVPGHAESVAQRLVERYRFTAPPAESQTPAQARTGPEPGSGHSTACPQSMSLLPRTPSSRGLRPRTAALRSSQRGAGFARLPRPIRQPRSATPRKVSPRCPDRSVTHVPGCTDTILISIDDKPDWSMKKARLLHEFMHAQRGWLLGGDSHAVDDCTHAWIWAETIHSMLIPCEVDGNVTCAQFQAMLNEYESFADACGPTAAECVIDAPPPCCVTWIGVK